MRRNNIFTIILLASAALLAACSQDELAEQSTMLPEGAYPLQIGSVTIDAQSSERPWTRVAENSTGEGSLWENGDQIHVRIGDNTKTGVYAMGVSGVFPLNEIYWKSTQPATVTAWYSNIEGSATVSANTVSLADQSSRLAYVVQAVTPNATYGSEVDLEFKHQLAKVRVKLNGTQVTDNMMVEVNNYTACTVADGLVTGATTGWITMQKTSYGNATTTVYEANVVPGTVSNPNNLIRVGGQFNATGINLTELVAGQIYTIDLTVGNPVIDVSTYEGTTITLTQDTYVKGDGTQQDKQIRISSDIEVTLEGVNIKYGREAGILIADNCDATIIVNGDNTVASANLRSAAIQLGSNANITIIGATGKDEDKLTATGAVDEWGTFYYGAGIGSAGNTTCGNITISNVTVTATGARIDDDYGGAMGGAGIGAGYGNCGNITITDANVTAEGGYTSAGIGGSYIYYDNGGNCGDIEITGSTVTAIGGGNAAGIGGGDSSTCGNITITNSVLTDVTGGDYGAGIGSGYLGNCGDIKITGGSVNVTGGYRAAAIGMGEVSSTSIRIGSITITNSSITAKAGDNAAAIGFTIVSNGDTTMYGDKISITTELTQDQFLENLTVNKSITIGGAQPATTSDPYKIGKGYYDSRHGNRVFGLDGGTWPGITFISSDYPDGQHYNEGIGQWQSGNSE